MKPKGLLAGAALLVVIAALAIGADEKAKKTAPAKGGQMDEKAMMEAMAKYSTPGPEHKALEQFVGTWDATVKMWMTPGAPPQESTGTAENKMALGGRYLEQHYDGKFMDQPFTGVGYTGYDLYKKQYVGTWMDTMGTTIMNSTGTADPSGKPPHIRDVVTRPRWENVQDDGDYVHEKAVAGKHEIRAFPPGFFAKSEDTQGQNKF